MSSVRWRVPARHCAAEQLGRPCCAIVLGQDSGSTHSALGDSEGQELRHLRPRSPRTAPCAFERSTYNIGSLRSTSSLCGLGRQHAGCCTEAPKSCRQRLRRRKGRQPQALRELNRENEMPEGRNLVSRPLNHAAENRSLEPGRKRAVLAGGMLCTCPAPTSPSIPALLQLKSTARPRSAA